jgi:hypothetical protein
LDNGAVVDEVELGGSPEKRKSRMKNRSKKRIKSKIRSKSKINLPFGSFS